MSTACKTCLCGKDRGYENTSCIRYPGSDLPAAQEEPQAQVEEPVTEEEAPGAPVEDSDTAEEEAPEAPTQKTGRRRKSSGQAATK